MGEDPAPPPPAPCPGPGLEPPPPAHPKGGLFPGVPGKKSEDEPPPVAGALPAVSYTHLRAHET